MQCPENLSYWRPDEIAECVTGVSTELYSYIWNTLVPLYDKLPKEYPGEIAYKLEDYWEQIPGNFKEELVALSEKAPELNW